MKQEDFKPSLPILHPYLVHPMLNAEFFRFDVELPTAYQLHSDLTSCCFEDCKTWEDDARASNECQEITPVTP
jgi:hypothetical protein